MILTRTLLLSANKRRYKNVSIPDGIELDGHVTNGDSVLIRSLTAGEMDTFEMSNLRFAKGGDKVLVNQSGMEEHRRRLLRLVLVDEKKETLLGPEDDPAVIGLDGLVAQAIYLEACKHCGLKERDEDTEKNSKGTPAVAKPGN